MPTRAEQEASLAVTAQSFAELAGHYSDEHSKAVADCQRELKKAKARIAEAKARKIGRPVIILDP